MLRLMGLKRLMETNPTYCLTIKTIPFRKSDLLVACGSLIRQVRQAARLKPSHRFQVRERQIQMLWQLKSGNRQKIKSRLINKSSVRNDTQSQLKPVQMLKRNQGPAISDPGNQETPLWMSPTQFFYAIHPAGFYAPLSRTGWAASNPDELDGDAPIGAKPLLYPFSYIQKTLDSGQPVSGTSCTYGPRGPFQSNIRWSRWMLPFSVRV